MEGDTAMSKISEETIKCPKCGKESKFVMWSSINTVLNPEMKKKVLTGEIFKFKCNKCGCEARINYSSLYHHVSYKHQMCISDSSNRARRCYA